MSHAIGTTRYPKRVPRYSSHMGSFGKGYSNGRQVLAKKIILQSLACIILLFGIIWLQNRAEELPRNIVSQIRLRVVERTITPQEIFQSIAEAYEECVQYLSGSV